MKKKITKTLNKTDNSNSVGNITKTITSKTKQNILYN